MAQGNSRVGHRKRIKEKIAKNKGAHFLEDYELLEFFLFSSHPRKDVRDLAKNILGTIKSNNIGALIRLEENEMRKIADGSEAILSLLLALKEVCKRASYYKVKESKNILSDWLSVVEYFDLMIGGIGKEAFYVLYLDCSYALIDEKVYGHGTVDGIYVYNREIVKDALDCYASRIIVAHNHPTGSVLPSNADIEATQSLMKACNTVSIELLDHVIVGTGKYYSFRNQGLI